VNSEQYYDSSRMSYAQAVQLSSYDTVGRAMGMVSGM